MSNQNRCAAAPLREAKLKPNQFALPNGVVITEIPLLFQTDMVKAVLEDRKTETRRITKSLAKYCTDHEPSEFIRDEFRENNGEFFSVTCFSRGQAENPNIKSPYGKPGDILWVRESFYKLIHIQHGLSDPYYYKADLECQGWKFKYKPSIHMPKDAARIWLMVESISVERVQDITDEGAFREGIKAVENPPLKGEAYIDFLNLWESINGKDSWLQNPWVWVVKFRVLFKTGRPSLETIWQNWLDLQKPFGWSAYNHSDIETQSQSKRKEASNV